MKKIISLITALFLLFTIIACRTEKITDLTHDQDVTSITVPSENSTTMNSERFSVTCNTVYDKFQVIPGNRISGNAECEIRTPWFSYGIDLSKTVYMARISSRNSSDNDDVSIKTITVCAHIDSIASFSWERIEEIEYSDGSLKRNPVRIGYVFALMTISRIIELNYETDNRKFDARGLVGEKVGVVFSPFPFWYYDDSGNKIKVCGYRYGNNISDYGYVPKQGIDVILSLTCTGNDNKIGFDNVTASEILERNKASVDLYSSIMSSNETASVESAMRLYDSDSKIFLANLFGGVLSPCVDLNGNEICNREQLDDFFFSLDEYFRCKEGVEELWCNGYYGSIMPPEINDVLRNISIGFE